jgi:hypothetical protein
MNTEKKVTQKNIDSLLDDYLEKEQLTKLAKAVLYSYTDDHDGIPYCVHCENDEIFDGTKYIINHKDDCVVLVAKNIIEKYNPEETLIVHNVMSYRGKNYLKHISTRGCEGCEFHTEEIGKPQKCKDSMHIRGVIWKSFDDIEITDELACMRKDIGDIYVMIIEENRVDNLIAVDNKSVITSGWRATLSNIRLATTEELQKYFQENIR